jgi:RNase P/RNase MRP subunit POP5
LYKDLKDELENNDEYLDFEIIIEESSDEENKKRTSKEI